jgi:hypothetical protein
LKKQGYGKEYYKNGDVFDGEWDNDLKHGKGVHFYANGDKFNGRYVKGKRHGNGRFYNKLETYEEKGEWKDDIKIGLHRIIYISKEEYKSYNE